MGQDQRFGIIEMMVIVAAAGFVVLGTYARPLRGAGRLGDTADSRLATVLAVADHGTWYIDRPIDGPPNPFEQRTIDKVMIEAGGKPRILSSKPPMLPLLMTAEYAALRGIFGWRLVDEAQAIDEDGVESIVRFMSITLIGLAYLVTLIYFARTLRFVVDDPLVRLVCLFALAFCTQLWGYSTNINNHVPAAAMVMVSLYYGLGLSLGKLDPSAWRFALFGLAGGMVPALDMPAGIFVAAAGALLFRRFPMPRLFWAAIGAAVPLAVHFAINISITDAMLPVQTRGDLYLYEASYWRVPLGVDALNEPKGAYLWHLTFGRFGLFSLYPITVLGVVAAAWAVRRRDLPHRTLLLGGGASFAILLVYYAYSTNNYGGQAFGFRWFIVAMPVLLLMAGPYLESFRRRWAWLIVALLMSVSFYSAWQCTTTPWAKNVEWTTEFMGKTY